ncbi:DUF7257 domain-containing protein [Gordonia terrae]
MTHPAPWSPPSTGIVAAGATPGGPEGLADFANWDEPTWNGFLNAKFAAWLEKYNVPFEYLNNLANSIVLAFQGDPGPLEDLIEDAVREIPIVGDILADLWDAIRGEYEGDHPILLAIQGLFAPIRRVVQIFTGRPGGLGASASEVDDFWGDMRKTLRGEDTVGEWFDDVSIAVASGVQDLADNIRNAVQGGVAAGTGAIAEAFEVVANLFGIADNAEKIAMAAQQQLQEITNETNAPGWSGYSWSTIFSGADGTPLPSTDWATTRMAIAGDDGHAGLINNSTDGEHFCTVRDIHKFQTDSQSASVVVGNKLSFSEDRWTSIRLRCDDDENPTQGAVCWFRPGNVRIGRFAAGSSTVWYTASRAIKSGDIIRFRCHGDNYYVLVNGVTIVSWTDTTAAVSKGAAFRHASFTQEYLNGLLYDQASFRIASWAMADWLPQGGAVTTPAWRLRRGAGSAVALTVGHGSQAQMPSSFYTVNDLASAVTVTDLGSGQITITETGWYEIAATSTNVDTSDAASGFGTQDSLANAYRPSLWVLYVDGVAVAGPIMAGVSATVYLAAGQVVRTGVSASWPFTSDVSGDSSGYSTYSRSNITHVTGAPSASFTGRKVA